MSSNDGKIGGPRPPLPPVQAEPVVVAKAKQVEKDAKPLDSVEPGGPATADLPRIQQAGPASKLPAAQLKTLQALAARAGVGDESVPIGPRAAFPFDELAGAAWPPYLTREQLLRSTPASGAAALDPRVRPPLNEEQRRAIAAVLHDGGGKHAALRTLNHATLSRHLLEAEVDGHGCAALLAEVSTLRSSATEERARLAAANTERARIERELKEEHAMRTRLDPTSDLFVSVSFADYAKRRSLDAAGRLTDDLTLVETPAISLATIDAELAERAGKCDATERNLAERAAALEALLDQRDAAWTKVQTLARGVLA